MSANLFQGIVDLYGDNACDFAAAKAAGVRAILHQTSAGLYRRDAKYLERRKQALDQGFLWAGYHLLTTENTADQLDRFLSIEDGSDPRIGLALDWEPNHKMMMSVVQLREFIELFRVAMRPRYADRFPILYAGNVLKNTPSIMAGDPLLAQCPLWYARFALTSSGFPLKTWPSYTLWQFDDEKRKYGAPPTNVLPGADWNRFAGTETDLQMAWPFGGARAAGALAASLTLSAGVAPAAPLAANASFAGRAIALAEQEWKFFGLQTYGPNGEVTHAGRKEGEDGYCQRVGEYWRDGVTRPGLDGRDHDWAWSAAFISWLLRFAGAGTAFRYSSQHSVYISQAIRDRLQGVASAGFWGWRLNELAPKPGDLVCWSREIGVDYSHQKGGDYKGHSDLVVAVGPTAVEVIGGNVGDSVTRRPLPLDASGHLQPIVQGGETLFALMENRLG